MFKRNLINAPRRVRGGLTSCILLQKGDVPGDKLAITWVDVGPGSAQRPHAHDSEQVYVIIQGRGCMQVDDERQEVKAGDLIHISSGIRHHIENLSADQVLTYISAATPAFNLIALYDAGDLVEDTSTGH
ncbi:MAG TPA: cupin domain-containing protein [Methanotrichaceae archaeon]|nr:cupin domain-containing protein [Methanotrichaceae archaeon]